MNGGKLDTKVVVITVDENQLEQIQQVANNLREAGLEVREIHATIGIIIGSIGNTKRANLTSIPGVTAVEEERSIQLPPPNSNIQ